MKRSFMVFVSAAACLSFGGVCGRLRAEERDKTPAPVCLQLDSALGNDVLMWTKLMATRIFDGLGLRLQWSCREPGTIRVVLRESRTRDPRGALGYALPFARDGVRAVVLVDRCRMAMDGSAGSAGAILGHVLAHEVAHVFIGQDGHAEWGLMKARWTGEDLSSMRIGPLPAAPESARLIRGGADAARHHSGLGSAADGERASRGIAVSAAP